MGETWRYKTKILYSFQSFYQNFYLDNDGPYYWHIKSGTIQREIPIVEEKSEKTDTNFKETDILMSPFENNTSVTRSSTSSALDLDGDERKRKEDITFK